MSSDSFQDVFLITFDFKEGERPDNVKFSGWVNQTDSAFSRIQAGIGDPWDYTGHTAVGATDGLLLSPTRLGQPSIARILGPSDFLSPSGTVLSQYTGNSITVTLKSGRNSWCLGFPLMSMTTVDPTSGLNDCTMWTSTTWGTNVSIDTDLNSALGTLQDDLEDVTTEGYYHVDYYTGTITCFEVTTADIELTIDDINVFAGGPPWATHNVIPTWEEGTSLCTVELNRTSGGWNYYWVDLPTVSKTPRVSASMMRGASGSATTPGDVTMTGTNSPAYGLNYELPYAITSVLTDGEAIPEGYMYLWDDDQKRLVSLCTFYYKTATRVEIKTSRTLVPAGSPNSSKYRLITCGCSAAEVCNYLSNVVRDNRHIGLTEGGTVTSTLAYTPPLSHHNLVDNWAVVNDGLTNNVVDSDQEDKYGTFSFTKSLYATNDHPQYLHRAGYMENDEANTGNAMRGWLVFASRFVESGDYPWQCSGGADSDSGNLKATYGIAFGGPSMDETIGNARFSFEGGRGLETWTNNYPHRFGFGLPNVGAYPSNYTDTDTDSCYLGALTYTPWYGTPLYLRGVYSGSFLTQDYTGAVLGWDLSRRGELNYIKLFPGIRGDGGDDVPNVPAEVDQDTFSTELDITPDLSNRLAPEQIREWRFRGVPWIPYSKNPDDSLGAGLTTYEDELILDITGITGVPTLSVVVTGNYAADFPTGASVEISGTVSNDGDYSVTSVLQTGGLTYVYLDGSLVVQPGAGGTITVSRNEFRRLFVSPGMVGADFLNVYSNAIFFSDQGDGQLTSFTELGEDWLNNSANDRPTGIYYIPEEFTAGYSRFRFETGGSTQDTAAEIGYKHGARFKSTLGTVCGLQFEGHDGSGQRVGCNTTAAGSSTAWGTSYGLQCAVFVVSNVTISQVFEEHKYILCDATRRPYSISSQAEFNDRTVGFQVLIEQEVEGVSYYYPLQGIQNVGGFWYWMTPQLNYNGGALRLDVYSGEFMWNNTEEDEFLSGTGTDTVNLKVMYWYITDRPT